MISFLCLLFRQQSSRLNQQGFMVSTQVPSLKDASVRHDGVILSLANDMYVPYHSVPMCYICVSLVYIISWKFDIIHKRTMFVDNLPTI